MKERRLKLLLEDFNCWNCQGKGVIEIPDTRASNTTECPNDASTDTIEYKYCPTCGQRIKEGV